MSAITLLTHDLEFQLVFVCKRMQDHYKTIKQFGLITCSGVTKGPADPAVRRGAILGGRQIVV